MFLLISRLTVKQRSRNRRGKLHRVIGVHLLTVRHLVEFGGRILLSGIVEQ